MNWTTAIPPTTPIPTSSATHPEAEAVRSSTWAPSCPQISLTSPSVPAPSKASRIRPGAMEGASAPKTTSPAPNP